MISDSDDNEDEILSQKIETKKKRNNTAKPAPVKKRARRTEGNGNNLVDVIAKTQLKTTEAYKKGLRS